MLFIPLLQENIVMPPMMPFPFDGPFSAFRGPPLESLLIELAYFFAVAAICTFIYLRTREIYQLSQHRGVFYFENIFLFFALSYLFRLASVTILISEETFSTMLPMFVRAFALFLVGYSSTMAILSLAMAALVKDVKISENKKAPFVLNGIAIVLALFAAVPRSDFILIVLQTVLLAAALFAVFFLPSKEKHKKLLSQNKVTYILLAVFWIINLPLSSVPFGPFYFKIPLYALSIIVFLSIFLRVKKRLPSDAKKKRQV